MKNSPLVSIIVPCYNQACFLPETLESVIRQTYTEWECIIVNDGSKDNTEEVSLSYTKKDNRIKYIYQENKGLSAARNTGISISKGKYILPLDSDDLIKDSYIEKAVSILGNDDDIEIVYARAGLFGAMTGEWKLTDYSLENILGQNCIYCSALYRRTTYDAVGGYKTNMIYGFEDWDFWLSIIENNEKTKIHRIDEILFLYRVRKNSMARSMDTDKIYKMRKQIWCNHKSLYANNFYSPIHSFEYYSVRNSLEYKLGSLLLKPVYKLKKLFKGAK